MRLITYLALLPAVASSSSGLIVKVYEGPNECEDENKVQKGNRLSMHYTGRIDESSSAGEKGSKFDSSRDRGSTFDFTIGTGQVIAGWDEGLLGLCVGAKATLIIPPDMGYGDRGAGGTIPGGATLNFDVEVVAINADGGEPGMDEHDENLFEKIDTNGDRKLDHDEILAYFKTMGQDTVPAELWETEDKDSDGFISWDEFSGPKGQPMGDEF